MSEKNGRDTEEKKNINITSRSLDSLRRSWAKRDIQHMADKSLKKLDGLVDEEGFKKKVEHQARAKAAQRALLNKKRKVSADEISDSASRAGSVYEAKAANVKAKKRKVHREGVIHRTVRLIKGLKALSSELNGRDFVTDEQSGGRIKELLWDAWQPLCRSAADFEQNLWSFIDDFLQDGWDILLFIADIVIKIWFYLTKLFSWLGEGLWDIRFFLEENKHKLFLWFSAVISVAAFIAITVSSVSAFEYSYYGRKLGVTRNKQEVYRAIDVLGDKLSEANGANINVDVSRDIQFKKIYGFKPNVDSADTILNNITYMKDFQADAFAINIDGKTSVIVESEERANEIIESYSESFIPEDETAQIKDFRFMEIVTIEPVRVLLGDIWNAGDAIRYLRTGSVNELAEGEEPEPKINVYSVEEATYEETTDFDIEYIDAPDLYTDEVELCSPGAVGRARVVAEIERYNGVEQKRNVLSSTKITDPVSAVYYRGTKPIPEAFGTGQFIFPLRDPYIFSTAFGESYGIPGVNPVHQGNDYAAPAGTHIYAADGGVVTFAGYDYSGYGLHIIIDHGGLYQTLYGHCSEIFVSAGDEVYQGKHIGNVGSTGVSTGDHLHFEVRYKGTPIDPMSVFY